MIRNIIETGITAKGSRYEIYLFTNAQNGAESIGVSLTNEDGYFRFQHRDASPEAEAELRKYLM